MTEAETKPDAPAPRRRRLKTTFEAIAVGLGVIPALPAPPCPPGLGKALGPVFTTLGIDLLIDIGAGAGEFAAIARGCGYTGHIASFEPIATLFAALETHAAADGRWEASPIAIGAAAGSLPLNVMKFGRVAATRATITRRHVIMNTLDQVIPPLLARHDARRIFLRINAPGRERDILTGAEQSISRIAAIQAPLSTTLKSDDVPHYLAMLSLFEAKRFTPHRFYPINGDALGPGEFACCLVRRPAESAG